MKSQRAAVRLKALWRELAFPLTVNLILGVVILHLGAQVSADMSWGADTDSQTVLESPQSPHLIQDEEPTAVPPEDATDTPTATHTSVPPTPTETHTPAPPSPTPTNTPIPPTATHTPTRTPKPTKTPTSTPKPTKTSTPTRTPTLPPLPTIVRFVADRYSVNQGEAVVLSWEVTGATTVQIMPGWEGGLAPSGSQTVYPNVVMSYRLHACNVDRCLDQGVTIQVNPAPPVPTSPPGPPPPPTETPPPTPRPVRVRQIIDRLADVWPASCPR